MNTPEFVLNLFSKPPAPPCTLLLATNISENDEYYRQKMLPLLMDILVKGAKILFGEHIAPKDISAAQFETLQKYFRSFGFVIKYNYTMSTSDTPQRINIWFDKLKPKQLCSGIIIY